MEQAQIMGSEELTNTNSQQLEVTLVPDNKIYMTFLCKHNVCYVDNTACLE